ncbi:MAG: GntR family transcriptional regulator [Chloroflexota bacterium]
MLVEAALEGVEVDRSGLEERVYAVLRQKILDRELVPGAVLTIRQVAAALGVSPTPVRDALRRLQSEALVRERGRLGAEVVGLSAQDIIDLFGARAALETYAARIAALSHSPALIASMRAVVRRFPETFHGNHYTDYERFATLDSEFHYQIIGAADNDRLMRMDQALHVHIQLARIYQREVEQRALANHREHEAIVEALAEGDAEGMARAANAHIENVRDHILHIMGPGDVVI